MRQNWTREETIIAFNVYCKIPFKDSSSRHPLIIEFSKIIGRTPSALNMKIGNLGRFDPELKARGITGLKNGSKTEEIVWNEFNENWEELAFESERLISEFKGEDIIDSNLSKEIDIPLGLERMQIIKARVNQNLFRDAVLSSYNNKCCFTGLPIPEMLIASHIIPWCENSKARLNPRNGLCLNSLHDKAFDRGYMTVTTDYKIKVSKILDKFSQDSNVISFLLRFENQKIRMPDRFFPSKESLDYHNHKIFIK